jgi:hypothetical protein
LLLLNGSESGPLSFDLTKEISTLSQTSLTIVKQEIAIDQDMQGELPAEV